MIVRAPTHVGLPARDLEHSLHLCREMDGFEGYSACSRLAIRGPSAATLVGLPDVSFQRADSEHDGTRVEPVRA